MKPFNEHGTQTVKDHKPGDYILHGDVILFMVTGTPEGFETMKPEPMNALAYGELSGHLHQVQGRCGIDFDLRVNEQTKERHLRVVNPVLLKHQEHSPIKLPPGDYKIGIQREYDPFEQIIREVAD